MLNFSFKKMVNVEDVIIVAKNASIGLTIALHASQLITWTLYDMNVPLIA